MSIKWHYIPSNHILQLCSIMNDIDSTKMIIIGRMSWCLLVRKHWRNCRHELLSCQRKWKFFHNCSCNFQRCPPYYFLRYFVVPSFAIFNKEYFENFIHDTICHRLKIRRWTLSMKLKEENSVHRHICKCISMCFATAYKSKVHLTMCVILQQ